MTTTTNNVIWHPASRPVRSGRKPERFKPERFWPSLTAMWHAIQTRRLLTEMDDRMLADIGIGRGEALAEAARRPWDVR